MAENDLTLIALRASCADVCSYAAPGAPGTGCYGECRRDLADFNQDEIRNMQVVVRALGAHRGWRLVRFDHLATIMSLRALSPPEPTEGRAKRLREALEAVQWAGRDRFRCVECEGQPSTGHTKECRVGVALAECAALCAMPLQDHATMVQAIHMLIRLVRMKVPGDEPNEVQFAFAALRGEPVSMWQPISTIPSSDDLVWLANSKTLSIEGPRAPGVFDADSFDLWCECDYPPLPAMVAEDRVEKQP